MDLIHNKYYIVRKGNFATNGNTKIMYSLLTLIFCIDDYYKNKSTDCISIMLGSTLIWTLIELLLHLSNTRVIKPMYINFFGSKKYLNKYFGIFLQGFQEGGFITTFGLYFGDRMFKLKYVILLIIITYFIIIDILIKNSTILSSKRQINTIPSLSFISVITLYNGYCLYNNFSDFYRQMMMFLLMIYISTVWTFFAWLKGFRTVEIYIKNNNSRIDNQQYNKKSINIFDEFFILGYDVVFEIGIAYMLFYNLFIL
tara:strand:+ start:165 stop:932 length:768 start_codon:yes stop_codon:yes gene_type:complete